MGPDAYLVHFKGFKKSSNKVKFFEHIRPIKERNQIKKKKKVAPELVLTSQNPISARVGPTTRATSSAGGEISGYTDSSTDKLETTQRYIKLDNSIHCRTCTNIKLIES